MTIKEAKEKYGSIRATAKAIGRARKTVRTWLADTPDKVVKEVEQKKNLSHPHVWVKSDVKRWALFADEHHPYGDEEAQNIAHDYAAQSSVDGIILQGDYADFYRVSHWKKDPLRMEFHEEIEECNKALEFLSNMFKSQKKVFLVGNHEMRMQHWLWSKGREIAGLPSMQLSELLRLGLYGFDYVDNIHEMNNGGIPFKLGKLHILHGHEMRCSAAAVNISRIYYLKAGVNVTTAHHHQPQEYIHRLLNGKHEGSWSVGCLCQLSEEYAPVTNWCHGFGIVDVYEDGSFEFMNKKIINGRVL